MWPFVDTKCTSYIAERARVFHCEFVFYQISEDHAIISQIFGSCLAKDFFKAYCFPLLHVQFRVNCGRVSIRIMGKCCIMTMFYKLFCAKWPCRIFPKDLTYYHTWWSSECVLNFIIIIESNVWIINHCLGRSWNNGMQCISYYVLIDTR